MLLQICKAKLHRLTVTDADLNYVGSITLDQSLLSAANIRPFEMVQITSLATGVRWSTYVIPAPADSGTVCLNGSAARHFHPGDLIIVLASVLCTDTEADRLVSRVVFVDGENRVSQVAQFSQEKPV